MKTAINLIHDAAINCVSSLLDETVLVQNLDGVNFFADHCHGESFKDIQLSAICCLSHRNFFNANDPTWRAATLSLHGHGWTDAVFEYFENNLENKPFPAPGAMYELNLKSIGGLVICTKGIHRLVAAKTWLINKYGDGSVLKSAKINRYELHPDMKKLAQRCLETKEKIFISLVGVEEIYLKTEQHKQIHFFVRIGKNEFFLMAENILSRVTNAWNLQDFLLAITGKASLLKRSNWKEVPHFALEKMLRPF